MEQDHISEYIFTSEAVELTSPVPALFDISILSCSWPLSPEHPPHPRLHPTRTIEIAAELSNTNLLFFIFLPPLSSIFQQFLNPFFYQWHPPPPPPPLELPPGIPSIIDPPTSVASAIIVTFEYFDTVTFPNTFTALFENSTGITPFSEASTRTDLLVSC